LVIFDVIVNIKNLCNIIYVLFDFEIALTIFTFRESEHGPIPLGAFVILRTGWNRFYNQEQKYFGQFEGEEKIMIPG